ncbi:MAG: hypothetical protein ACO32I_02725 [Candidatus Limnocylindrus sp.]
MDDDLLNALYGVSDEQYEDDDLVKQAQAELIESVAAEAGIDLDDLDDDELDKFAEYVLTGSEGGDMSDPALAEADRMGRAMAHAYADEQIKIAQLMEEGAYPGMESDPYEDVLAYHADNWDMMKMAAATELKGEFDRMSRADKMRLAKGDYGRVGGKAGGEKLTRGDTEYSRRQRAAAMIGRGTGYYDIKSGRQVLRRAQGIEDQIGEKAARDLRRTGQYSKTIKELSKADEKALRRAFIKNETAVAPNALFQFNSRVPLNDALQLHDLYTADIGKKTGRGLMLRGGLKAVGSAGLLGGAGYLGYNALGGGSRRR